MCVIPNTLQVFSNSSDVNSRPLSVIIFSGTPKIAIQLLLNTFVTESEDLSERGAI